MPAYAVMALVAALAAVSALRPSLTAGVDLAAAEFPPVYLIGLVSGALAARDATATGRPRRPWWIITVFFAVTALAGVLLGVALGGAAPREWALWCSIGLRVLAALVLLAGLLAFGSDQMSRRDRFRFAFDSLVVTGGGFMLIWYFVIGPALAAPPGSAFTRFATVAYPLVDLLLVLGVCVVLQRGVAEGDRRELRILLCGTIAYLIGDLVLSYVTIHVPEYRPDAEFNLLVLAPLVLIAAAAVERCRRGPHTDATARRPGTTARRFLPYAALLAGFALLGLAAVQSGLYPWGGLVVGSVAMVGGVLGRQLLALRDNRRLLATDPLTGLANRTRLTADLERALRRAQRTREPVAVLLIDLNGFKETNDRYGHEAGDAVLAAFGDVLRRHVRAADTAARLGGDEFAVVLGDVGTQARVGAIGDRILRTAAETRPLGDIPVGIRASIGAAVGTPDPAQDVEPQARDLMRRADAAMYAAKRAGSGVCLLDPPIGDEVARIGCPLTPPGSRRAWPTGHAGPTPDRR
ncbi:diguanylate cyclase (GGDEF)-like protein [Catenuloplanes nepalensis]|uniref:Diguanylate cyclase (GGDEF)-like protein n=1 Tax=Catenuloplanes nepalensis TaxID=587533 RepID=A0ABT9MNQ0_9ACTN|nr:GGDEF domain-containing protein [Catenuloplanes nepalensis]MDP9793022.1 diguanylate cyclase (GGDEF)-like protein [Catenuloplanes nepalensis]